MNYNFLNYDKNCYHYQLKKAICCVRRGISETRGCSKGASLTYYVKLSKMRLFVEAVRPQSLS